ncbi:TPA: hypothetical protein LTU01_002871, partial [Listeria monocytogenes]|nr:hypothetical protein [Listeria monocytogenes]
DFLSENYYEMCISFFKEDKASCSTDEFIQKLFFLHPTLKVDVDLLHQIIKQINNRLNIPYHDIKVIGSSHTGFSFIDKSRTNKVKFYDDNKPSDIDIAIINSDLFVDVLEKTVKKTDNYTNNTYFSKQDSVNYFKRNISSGFIRPDSIGCDETRNMWLDFFSDLSNDYDLKISGAIYLNETFFLERIKNQLHKFKNITEVQSGIK